WGYFRMRESPAHRNVLAHTGCRLECCWAKTASRREPRYGNSSSHSRLHLSLLLVPACPGKKDLIVMNNGDRFTGEIKGLSGGTLFVSLDYVDGNIAVQCRRWPISRAVGCLWSKLKAEWYTPGR